MSVGIPHVIAHLVEQPWALRPVTLALMRGILVRKHLGHRLSPDEISAAIGEPRADRAPVRLYDPDSDQFYRERWDPETGEPLGYRSESSGQRLVQPKGGVVAVLGVMGVIAQRASQVEDVSGPGGTSTERLTQRFRSTLNDNQVKAIVFDVDSPGGGVYGVQELADEIRGSRGSKPIVAVANSLAASAAYWLASAADEVVVTPSGEVGSIGVFGAHEDLSAMLEAEGVKVTLVSAGKFKTEGNPFEALGEEARAAIQSRVNDYYNAFTKAVSKGRGVKVDDVRNGMGQGRVLGAKAAIAEKMADSEGTLDETVRRLAGRKGEALQATATIVPAAARQASSIDVTLEAEAARQRAMIGR